MGLSFHDDESMVEATTTLRFQVQSASDESDNSNSVSETLRSSERVHKSDESNDVFEIGVQQDKDYRYS